MVEKGEWETNSTEDIQCIYLRNAALAAVLKGGQEGLDEFTAICSKCRKASVTWKRRGNRPVFVVRGEENCNQTVII